MDTTQSITDAHAGLLKEISKLKSDRELVEREGKVEFDDVPKFLEELDRFEEESAKAEIELR